MIHIQVCLLFYRFLQNRCEIIQKAFQLTCPNIFYMDTHLNYEVPQSLLLTTVIQVVF